MGQPELIVVGDEAWTPEEWERKQKDRADRAAYKRTPKRRAYQAAYIRRQRDPSFSSKGAVQVVASLHGLRCTGPTRLTGCVCRKTLVVRPVK